MEQTKFIHHHLGNVLREEVGRIDQSVHSSADPVNVFLAIAEVALRVGGLGDEVPRQSHPQGQTSFSRFALEKRNRHVP